MEPENVRTLLATSPNNLEKVARKMELPLPIARDIRVQAMNLVLGRCVLCGKKTLTGMCGHCKKEAGYRRVLPWSSIRFLKMLKPSDQLLRQTCETCGGHFMLSASYLLRKLLLKHPEADRKTCFSCFEKAQKKARQLEEQKIEEERCRRAEESRRRKEEAEQQRQEKEQRASESRTRFFHKPFANNVELQELRKVLPRAPQQRRPQKSAKNP